MDKVEIYNVVEIHNYFHIMITMGKALVDQSCPTLCDHMDHSPPGPSFHGILQARILEFIAISFSRGSSQPRDRNQVSHTAGRLFTIWAAREAQLWGKCNLTLSSVQSLSRVQLFATPWITAHQASLSITNSRSLLKLMSIESEMPSNHLILCHPLLLLPPIPPSIRVFFQWVNSSHEVTKVLEFQLQHQSFQWTPRTYLLQDGLVGSPCSPRDSQESSSAPQFKSINFSALSFLHSPTLTSIHDHWKNHSLN